MTTIEAANRAEAKALSATNPQAIVIDKSTGNLWIGPATLVPVRGEGQSYLCYTDHEFDCSGVVRKTESGLWGAFCHQELIALRPTLRDAAIDLAQHVA